MRSWGRGGTHGFWIGMFGCDLEVAIETEATRYSRGPLCSLSCLNHAWSCTWLNRSQVLQKPKIWYIHALVLLSCKPVGLESFVELLFPYWSQTINSICWCELMFRKLEWRRINTRQRTAVNKDGDPHKLPLNRPKI